MPAIRFRFSENDRIVRKCLLSERLKNGLIGSLPHFHKVVQRQGEAAAGLRAEQEAVLIWKRPLLMFIALIVIRVLLPVGAFAADQACIGVDTHITDARKHEFAALVANALTVNIKPSTVSFQSFMVSGAWSAVYASAPETEPGFFFFETVGVQKRFKDVWGGFAVPEDRPELMKWAKALGAPENLAKCFAQAVTD